jgi:hypothetical protein
MAGNRAKPKPCDLQVTGVELGEVLGLTKGRVAQLAKQGVFPRVGRRYPLGVCVQAYTTYKATSTQPTDLKTETTRLRAAQARAVELTTATKERRLVERDDVGDVLTELASGIPLELAAVPGRLAHALINQSNAGIVAARIKAEIDRARGNIADAWEAAVARYEPAGGG